jgi:hypothetical protein
MLKTITSWMLAGLMMTATIGCSQTEDAATDLADEISDVVEDGVDATAEMAAEMTNEDAAEITEPAAE